ncbi:MAG: TPM domain-containing protein [Anaerolineae bacterium]
MRRRMWIFSAALCLLLAALVVPVLAQSGYPSRGDTYINDFNTMMPSDLEAKLRGWLTDLKTQNGIEMTVVTINSIKDYGTQSSTIEQFATNLFNRWGIGERATNKGVMLLVARSDRKVRLELGSGYSSSYDSRAKGVIDEFILPSFKQENYEAGIEKGVRGTIYMLTGAWPSGGAPTFFEQVGDKMAQVDPLVWLAGIGALILGAGGTVWYRESHRCPMCSQVSLQINSTVLVSPTEYSEGEKEVHKYCPNCQYTTTAIVAMARISSSDSGSSGSSGSSDSSGGGSSSGGGATGSW